MTVTVVGCGADPAAGGQSVGWVFLALVAAAVRGGAAVASKGHSDPWGSLAAKGGGPGYQGPGLVAVVGAAAAAVVSASEPDRDGGEPCQGRERGEDRGTGPPWGRDASGMGLPWGRAGDGTGPGTISDRVFSQVTPNGKPARW